MTSQIWIITGEREAGKTRFCEKVIMEARARGLAISGLLSPAVFENGVKSAIRVQNLATGESKTLADAREEIPDAATPHWKFDAAALTWGSAVLRHSTPTDLLVVDELGPLEFLHASGWVEGFKALDEGNYRAAMVVIRPEMVANAREHWPNAQFISILRSETYEENSRHLAIILENLE